MGNKRPVTPPELWNIRGNSWHYSFPRSVHCRSIAFLLGNARFHAQFQVDLHSFDQKILSFEVWLHNNCHKCHKIYLSVSLGMFCLYVILTISYLRAQTIETSSLLTDSSRPLFKQIVGDFFYIGCMTVYFTCKYFPLIYARVTRVPPRDWQ